MTKSSIFGILFMLINTLSLAFLDIAAKYLSGFISSTHIVFFYKASLLIFILPWVFKQGLTGIKSSKLLTHVIRSLFSVLGAMCFYKGLEYVQMADAAALENIQYIILVLVGVIFFNETLTKTKIFAMISGFIGAIIVVKPEIIDMFTTGNITSPGFNKYFGLILMAVGFWSMNSITVKILGRTEKNRTQMFYLALFATLWSIPFAIINWDTMQVFGFSLSIKPTGVISLEEFRMETKFIPYILFMALCYFIHGIAYFNSMKYDLSVVAPFRYTKLLFSGILGYIFFNELQHANSFVGYTLIILSGLLLTRYEIRKYRKRRANA